MLAMKCVDDVIGSLSIESVARLWKAKGVFHQQLGSISSEISELELSYASSRTATPYLSYFASTTPDSEHKQRRLKAIIFLQSSTLYDPSIIRQRLTDDAKELTLELAIVEGKVSQMIATNTAYLAAIDHRSSAW
jgi:hypothetical protein